jgi:Carboxypeptidase regulatory-like domain
MYRRTINALLLTGALLLSASSVWGQVTGGRVSGIITDPTAAVVQNAAVTLKAHSTGQVLSTQSNESGSYSFPNVAVGDYTLTVQASGFQGSGRDLRVLLNQQTTLNLPLSIAAVQENLTVSATGQEIQTDSSQQLSSFSTDQIQQLPIFNDLNMLARLSPNVSKQSAGVHGAGGTVGGMRPHANSFNLDGVDNNDTVSTGTAVNVIQDAVEQFSVLRNNYNAEFGNGAAGQFNTITKSGSNNFHGSSFLYLQSQKLNASSALEEQQLQNGQLSKLPFRKDARYGFTIGGPIVKNKLFFFGAFQHEFKDQASTPSQYFAPTSEGLNQIAGLPGVSPYVVNYLRNNLTLASQATTSATQNFGTVLGVSGIPFGTVILPAPSSSSEYLSQINIDHSPNERNQFRYRFNAERMRAEKPGFGNINFASLFSYDARLFSATWIRTLSNSMVNDVRLSYRRVIENYPVKEASANALPYLEVSSIGLGLGPDALFPQGSPVNNSYQVYDALSYLKGNHNFKFGGEFRRVIFSTNFVQALRGSYIYDDLGQLLQDQVPGTQEVRGVSNGPFAGNHSQYYAFAQDDWKIRRNVTLNIGARYEYMTLPRDLASQSLNALANVPGVIEFNTPKTDHNNFAPRLGIAYSPDFEDGIGKFLFGAPAQSSLRANFSVSYVPTFQNLTLTSLPPQFQQLRDIFTSAAAFGFDPSRPFLENGGIPSQLIPITTPAAARAASSAYIPDQVSPYVMSWMFSYQRELTRTTVVEVGYLGTRARKLPVQLRLNAGVVNESNLVIPTFFSAPVASGLTTLPTLGQIKSLPGMNVRRLSPYGFSQALTSYQFAGNSQYDGASVSLTRRYNKGLAMTAAYTWSKTIDDSTNELNSSVPNPRRPQDFYNIKADRALSALDVPHRFAASVTYDLPFFKRNQNRAVEHVLGGWQLNAILEAQSGQPITPQSGKDANLNFDSISDRTIVNQNGIQGTASGVTPVNALGQTVAFGNASTVAYVVSNPNAQYVLAGPGAHANAGRNTLRTRGFNQTNASLLKSFHLADRYTFEVGAEASNLFNQRIRNLASLGDQTAASAVLFSTAGSPKFNDYSLGNAAGRSIQMRAKFIF